MSEAHKGEKAFWFGKTLSKETKQKLSEARKGEKNHMYGKTHSKETKQKLSEAMTGEKNPNYGKPLSKETKQKMSEATSGAKNHKSKTVYQYNLDGTYVNSFGSSGEAAQALEKNSRSLIGMCARGERPSAYGFKWSRVPPD